MGGAQEVPDSHAAGGTKHIRCCSAPDPEHTAGLVTLMEFHWLPLLVCTLTLELMTRRRVWRKFLRYIGHLHGSKCRASRLIYSLFSHRSLGTLRGKLCHPWGKGRPSKDYPE